MLAALKDTILSTPWWVYLILVYVLYRGIRALKTQVLPFKRVFMLPLILIVLSGYNLTAITTVTFSIIATFIVVLLMSIVLGWFSIKGSEIVVDHRNHLMKMPGSWWFLVILLIIFGCAYYTGYMTAVNPEIIHQPMFLHMTFIIHGFTIGVLVGRLGHSLYCYKTKPTVELSAK